MLEQAGQGHPQCTDGGSPWDTSHGKYFVVPCVAHPLDSDRVFMCQRNPVRVAVLSKPAAIVAGMASGARSLEEHALFVASITNIPQGVIADALTELRAAGIVQPLRNGWTRRTPGPGLGGREIGVVGIITADRPEMVDRCLEDIVEHKRRFGRPTRVYVIDGSRSIEGEDRTRAVAAAAQRDIDVVHVGAVERRRVSDRLIAAGAGAGVVRHSLEGGDAGANRNLFILLTAGETVLMTDDDIRWTAWRPPDYDARVIVGNHHNPFRTSFFDSRQAAVEAVTVADIDLLEAHEALLGRTVSELDSAPDLSEACGHLLARISNGCGPMIRVTMAGLTGEVVSVKWWKS